MNRENGLLSIYLTQGEKILTDRNTPGRNHFNSTYKKARPAQVRTGF